MKSLFKNFSLFGKKKQVDVKAKSREWTRAINKEVRRIDRDMDQMTRTEKSTTLEIRKLAAKGEVGSVKILAKELVFMRKAKDRLLMSKTQLKSISNQLAQQLAVAKLTNAFQSSAEVMKSMNAIVNVPEMHAIMTSMGKEMEQMGLVEKIMADGIDEALGDAVDVEQETEQEINKLMEELAIDKMIFVPSVGRDKLGSSTQVRNQAVNQNAQ